MNDRMIAPAFIVTFLSGIALMVTYGFGGNTQLEGLFIMLAFGGMGVGIILWAKHLMPNDEVIQERHHFDSSEDERDAFHETIGTAAGDVTRRKFLSRLGIAGLGSLGLAALFPLKSLGPNPDNSLFSTKWTKGARLVTHDNRALKADDLLVGSIQTVFPEGTVPEDATATLLIRVPADQFNARANRETWAPEGNVAYSKVCTHVGCPVSLYRETTKELLCPCHQSTFDVLDGGRPKFGPATRSLPQLPLSIDSDGYLIAQSDYREPIGPGFWNRDRRKKES